MPQNCGLVSSVGPTGIVDSLFFFLFNCLDLLGLEIPIFSLMSLTFHINKLRLHKRFKLVSNVHIVNSRPKICCPRASLRSTKCALSSKCVLHATSSPSVRQL